MKKILILVMVIMMMLVLTACGSDTQEAATDNTDQTAVENNRDATTPENTDGTFDYSDTYLADHLQGDYSITYRFTYYTEGEDTLVQTITCARAGDGYYIKMGEESTILYIKNGEKYDMYVGDPNGNLTKIEGMVATEEEVQAATLPFLGYMGAYAEYDDALHKSGDATVAGRSCEQYTYEGAYLDTSARYDYYIDKETGACLKFFMAVSDNNIKGSYEFECTEFKTSGVSLPNY